MEFTQEHEGIRRGVKKFIDTEINPHIDKWEEAGIFPAHDVFRKMGDQGWLPLPTYLPAGFRFAVAPLDASTGGSLIAASADGPRVEYYKVCWVPRATS